MEKVSMARDVAWGLAGIALGTLLALWLLARLAKRMRRHFDALLDLAQESFDAPHDVAAIRARMTALRLLMNAGKYVLVVSAILLVLRRLGVQLDALLLPAGFVGAALGLGAQNLVRDVVAGLFLVLEGQFAVGDVVGINGTVGVVDEIGLRVTRLRDESSHIHFFPNGAINAVETYPREPLLLMLRVPLDTRIFNSGNTLEAVISQPAQKFDTATASIDPGADSSESTDIDPTDIHPNAEGEDVIDAAAPASQTAVACDNATLPRARVERESVGEANKQSEIATPLSLDDARAIVLSAIERFDADYHVLEGPVAVSPSVALAETGKETTSREAETTSNPKDGADRERMEQVATWGEADAKNPGVTTLCFELPVRALRAVLVREKLPSRVSSTLEGGGFAIWHGAEVGVFSAPASKNETT